MFSQDDDSHGWVLGVVFGIVALVIALAVGLGIYQTNLKAKASAAATSANASAGAGSAAAVASTLAASATLAAAGATSSIAASSANTPAAADSASASAAAMAATAVSDAAMEKAALAAADAASVKLENGVVKFYFASGKSDVAKGGKEALAEVVKAVAGGKQAVVSGFNDATGDAAKNAELSKLRAFAVRDALKALGVAEDKIVLKKPESTTAAAGKSAEARRVEVSIQ